MQACNNILWDSSCSAIATNNKLNIQVILQKYNRFDWSRLSIYWSNDRQDKQQLYIYTGSRSRSCHCCKLSQWNAVNDCNALLRNNLWVSAGVVMASCDIFTLRSIPCVCANRKCKPNKLHHFIQLPYYVPLIPPWLLTVFIQLQKAYSSPINKEHVNMREVAMVTDI